MGLNLAAKEGSWEKAHCYSEYRGCFLVLFFKKEEEKKY